MMALFWTPEAIQDRSDIYNYIESASANRPWRSPYFFYLGAWVLSISLCNR